MSVSVKIELDKRSEKGDGKYPLKLLVVVNRKPIRISLGYSFRLKDWNEKLQTVRPTCNDFENITRFNNWLQKQKSKTLSKLISLQDDDKIERLSANDIKEYITQQKNELMALEFCTLIIQDLEKSKRFGNARVYTSLLRSLRQFTNMRDFPLKEIDFKWLKKYETWYLSKDNTINGLAVHLRTLRSVINTAIKQNRIPMDYYPFKHYTIKQEETRKRAISNDDLNRIIKFKPQTERQKRAKDYFLISFYLMGASFVDIANLQMKNIIKGRIEYKRQKTGKLHSIPISKPVKDILNQYTDGKKPDDYILNVIKSSEPKAQLNDIREELIRYNKTLKEIGTICKIEAPLTSYTSRHTYAMSGKRIGVPTAIISQSLGHTTEKTTQIYLDSFDNETVDKFHEKIIKLK